MPSPRERSRALASAVRQTVASVLHRSGALRLWARFALRNKAVVLMYHRVLPQAEWRQSGSHPGIVVTPETFAEHLALLKREFSVLTLAEFARKLAAREPFGRPSCLVTFDDGWWDNLAHALPLLRRHGIPAVIFLPVNYIGTRRRFWREALSHLLIAAIGRIPSDEALRDRVMSIVQPLGLGDLLGPEPPPTPHVIERIAEVALDRERADAIVSQLAATLGEDLDSTPNPDGFLSWDDIDTLAREGVSIGGHGAEHLRLTEVPLEVARRDISDSYARLRPLLPATAPAFSYPNGAWAPAIAAEVRAAGYRLAFTTEPGFVRCDDDHLAIRRINVHESATFTPSLFLARALGLF